MPCPECNSPLIATKPYVLESNPPQQDAECTMCDWEGRTLADDVELPYSEEDKG